MRTVTIALVVGVMVSAAVACASGTPEAGTPAGETPATTEAAKKAPVEIPATWQEGMSQEQEIEYMKTKVIPAMTPVFKAHDAEAYAKFGCETCHGPEYKNPTEYLPALTMKDGKLTAFEEDAEVAKFMAETVVPAMAGAMGMQPYNPETQQGFGCGGCHSIEQG